MRVFLKVKEANWRILPFHVKVSAAKDHGKKFFLQQLMAVFVSLSMILCLWKPPSSRYSVSLCKSDVTTDKTMTGIIIVC